MRVTLSADAKRFMRLFAEATDINPRDCLVADDRVVFVIPADEMADAIGPDGHTVERVEEKLGREIELIADADTPAAFVESTLAPAAVRGVTISEQGDRIAYVEVVEADRGIAIGSDGRRIETARRLAERHYEIDDIQLT
jgi:N utilization substance protein A